MTNVSYLRSSGSATVGLIFMLVALVGCTKTAEITGEVRDGFGQPLPGAAISVDKTTFTATTDRDGRYAVQYVPGKVSVKIAKDGFTSQETVFDIATEARYPAQSVTLYKIPADFGIYAFVGGNYLALPRVNLHYSEDRYDGGFTATHAVVGEFPYLPGGSELTFLDTENSASLIHAVGPEGTIRIYKQGYFPTVDTRRILADARVPVAPGMTLRKVKLPAGRYVFSSGEYKAHAFLFAIDAAPPQ